VPSIPRHYRFGLLGFVAVGTAVVAALALTGDPPAPAHFDFLDSGERPVLTGTDPDGELTLTIGTFTDDPRRDELFQAACARLFGYEPGSVTMLVVRVARPAPPGEADDAADAGGHDSRAVVDDGTTAGIPVGTPTVTLRLADGRRVTSVPPQSVATVDSPQLRLELARYCGEASLAPGGEIPRYVAFTDAIPIDDWASAEIVVAGRRIEATRATQTYPVPPR
jgi:hypothetical protein